MSNAIPPTSGDGLTFGQRLKIARTRRGMTRETLAGLCGRSASWVKALERGRLDTPKLPVLLRLAETLRVRDLAELTGDQSIAVNLFCGPGHPALPAVRTAVNALALGVDRPAPPVEHLRARLAQAWASRHSSPNHRAVLGTFLPGLIRDAQAAVYQAEAPANRQAAQAVLSEVYSLAQFFVAYQPAQDLLWRVAERGMVAAQEAGDPHAVGVAAWLTAQAHRDAGDWDAADVVTLDTLQWLEPHLPDAPVETRAVAGALRFEAGYTAARRGETGTAWRYWDAADQAAQRLPTHYYHPVTSFSRAIMGAHAVTVAVELHAGGEATRQASRADASLIPSRPRRARHQIEQARAYYMAADPDAAVATLETAHNAAPETIAYNSFARRILLEELDASQPRRRERAASVASRIGLLTA